MNETEAVQMLQTRPKEFLRNNAITPHAAPGANARVHNFFMVDANVPVRRPGARLGNFRPHQGQRFQIRPNSLMGGSPFNAIHIPVQPSNLPMNASPLSISGPGIMITTQLTGCCIVLEQQAGTWSVAHLQPIGESGQQLQRRLGSQGRQLYGRNDYPGRAVVVGVRRNSKWSFYAQRQDQGFDVHSVEKIV